MSMKIDTRGEDQGRNRAEIALTTIVRRRLPQLIMSEDGWGDGEGEHWLMAIAMQIDANQLKTNAQSAPADRT